MLNSKTSSEKGQSDMHVSITISDPLIGEINSCEIKD